MRSVTLFFAFSILSFSSFCQITIVGRVIDAESKAPLPFVNISVSSSTSGTATNLDGIFRLAAFPGDSLTFSYVGYQRLTISVTSAKEILLHQQVNTLEEIAVYAGENPAHAIIKKVIGHRSKNDPEELASFRYRAHHKLFATTEGVFDSLSRQSSAGSFLESHHLFMNETFSERKHLRPNFDQETVLANKMSGVKDPFFAVLATNFQSFGFYRQHIHLLDKDYINPISPGTFHRYEFNIEDTLARITDTTFIISFQPLKGKTFDGLKGVLYINTNHFAIENVLAEPCDPKSLISIKIQQQYTFTDSTWFPHVLNTEILFNEQKIADHPLKYVHRSYLSDIRINQAISKEEFGLLNVAFAPHANSRGEAFWNSARTDTLTAREKNTFTFFDSLPARRLALLNTSVNAFEALATGKIRAGRFYLPLEHVLRNNQYEGLRVGIGLQTGERISQTFVADGYVAYGFRDRAFKFGAGIQMNLKPLSETSLKISYSNDVREPGNGNFFKQPPSLASTQMIRNWLTSRMDSVTRFRLQLNLRPMRFSETSIFAQQSLHNPIYAYQFISTDNQPLTSYTLAEVGFQFKFILGEKFTQIGNSQIATDFKFPHVNFALVKSVRNILSGDFSYTRLEAKIDQQFLIKGFGKTSVQLSAGLIQGSAPYFSLFNSTGTNAGQFDLNSFVVPSYFQTMGVYEFTSTKTASVFFSHDFGRMVSTGSPYFRPGLVVMHNAGWGSLANRKQHEGLTMSTMTRGFLEAGALVNNLIRFNYFNFGYLGLGGGVFCRYGHYRFSDNQRNLVAKISVTFGL